MKGSTTQIDFHDQSAYLTTMPRVVIHETKFTYSFGNFFHPFVGKLVSKLNKESLPGVMDAKWQDSLSQPFFQSFYTPKDSDTVEVDYSPKEIDLSGAGPYANYNWELFFHIPLTVAVHLSKTQRFAEAQRWFHHIFDPTCNDHAVDPQYRFWKFLAFRRPRDSMTIDEVLRLLSIPVSEISAADKAAQDGLLNSYYDILNHPFQPHRVARTRHIAYQYSVVMKYLDNLIAWGDSLFQQDTVESINEATQRYVLAANILGPRPQRVPARGATRPKTFAQLKKEGLGPIGDSWVELEGQFPLNFAPSAVGSAAGTDTGSVFGIARSLYFCIPPNEKLLGYWDTVADRLFKIRHCMNIAGVVRPLALFDPPIDPGMLVKAAAAGIDIGSIVSGLNQPMGPVRCLTLIQKALELCGEVRGLGGALLSALEKGDSEHLALVRQRHEVQIQHMTQDVRFLQWKSAQESTKSLLTSRATALERLHYYQRLLGLPADPNAPDTLTLDQRELTEDNFDEAYGALVGQFDKQLTLQKFADLKLVGDSSPGIFSGYSGDGNVHLSANEDTELNFHLPAARDARVLASAANLIASGLVTAIPDPKAHAHYWGIGVSAELVGGSKLSAAVKMGSEIAQIAAAWEQDQAGMVSRYASYERRADEWLLQHNLAAHELTQIGRQILTSSIAEQIAHHEYLSTQQQIVNSREVDEVLRDKFTNEELYLWMQGELSRLYYEYYRVAFDTARKAERTMKQELMRPEVDAQDFVKFNYWDGGRKGLLSGEALHLDLKRMELAYHDNNKRELEITRHVSLRQLNPLALLSLKATGSCVVQVPEWLYDLDCPGHYMRRIKSVALSIPSVVGPYTSVNCTLSLLRSSVRRSPVTGDGYARQGSEDDRFIDYMGAVQSIVTSSASSDGGLFETNLRDERFLPFEGAGAESTWKLDLPDPAKYPAFDYATITDVIFHVRYTARQGVQPGSVTAALDDLLGDAAQNNLFLLFSLRHDFPNEWSSFVGGSDFSAVIRKDYFPYFTRGKTVSITGLDVYDAQNVTNHHSVAGPTGDLMLVDGDKGQFVLSIGHDADVANPAPVMTANAQVFLVVRYSLDSVS